MHTFCVLVWLQCCVVHLFSALAIATVTVTLLLLIRCTTAADCGCHRQHALQYATQKDYFVCLQAQCLISSVVLPFHVLHFLCVSISFPFSTLSR